MLHVKYPDESNLGEEGFISASSSRLLPITAKKSSQKLKQLVISHPWSRAGGNGHIPACICSARDLHSYTEQHLLLGSGTAHSGLGLPMSVNVRHSPTDKPKVDGSSLRLSSQVTVGVVKLTALTTILEEPHICHCLVLAC